MSRAHDITLVIDSMGGGGTQRVMLNLIKIWAEQGLRICLITSLGEDSDKYPLPANITRLCATRSSMWGLLDAVHKRYDASTSWIRVFLSIHHAILRMLCVIQDIRVLRRALRMADSPVVLAFLSFNNVNTILASAGLDIRVVVSERTDPDRQPRSWPWHAMKRWLYRYADAVTANSHGALKSMETYVPKSKLFFVPNPVSFPSVPARHARRKTIILNVGRLTREKAQDVLLRAYVRVAAKKPEWKLVIVGHGREKDELHALATSLGLCGRVAWIDWTVEIERYYERAGIFVLPSRYEGTPNALLEAMSFGLPSIVTDGSPGPLEHIANGKNGLIVPVDDEKRLADAILRLAASRELRDRMGASARRTIGALNNDDIQDAWSVVLGLPKDERVRQTASRLSGS